MKTKEKLLAGKTEALQKKYKQGGGFMRIIKAEPKDINTVHEIVHKTVSAIYPQYYPEGVIKFFLEHHSLNNLKTALEKEYVLLLEDFGQIVGTGALWENEIKRVFILPEFQKKGYGSFLLDELERTAMEKGYCEVILDTSLPAYRLYQKRGYDPLEFISMTTESGQVLCYYRMSKNLNGKYSAIDYNNKVFVSTSNSDNGEVSDKTVFNYRQWKDIIWACYSGGNIVKGYLVGKCHKDGKLEFSYQHVNTKKEIRTGKCKSIPEILPDGRIRLLESWEWTNGDRSKGSSVIEETREKNGL